MTNSIDIKKHINKLEKKWIFKSLPEKQLISQLNKTLNTSSLISKILIQRGIDTFNKAKNFFRPGLKNLHNPFLLHNIDFAVERILKSIFKSEKILIFGDYDVDGTTGVTLLYNFFKNIGLDIKYYIPDRYTEGYGLSKIGIEYAKKNNINLIITVDCGIRAVEMVDLAKKYNIEVIICDHHNPAKKLPNAYAILNPKKTECHYPFDGLSGCGVAFKLLQAIYFSAKNIDIDLYISDPLKSFLKKHKDYISKINWPNPLIYLDLVAVSIAADIVPIVDENRILMHYGLEVLSSYINILNEVENQKPDNENFNRTNYGLLSLLKNLNYKFVDVSKIVFGIAPRINAAGRISHAHKAVKLLTSKSSAEAYSIVNIIEKHNLKRKELDSSISKEAYEKIESFQKYESQYAIVLFDKQWHKGVLGIVASRCVEKFYKPTIIMSESNGKIVGSARSVPGFNIYQAIDKCGYLLEKYGGHKYAAGLTLNIKNLQQFKNTFKKTVSETISYDLLIPKQIIDLKIEFDEINIKCYNILKQMSPFGPGNMSPIFSSDHLFASKIQILKENHLKFIAYQKNNKNTFEAIGFNMAKNINMIQNNKPFNLAYKINLNTFNGKSNIQLEIKDIQNL